MRSNDRFQLGLLHRRLKHQQQRIILFVGSPLGPEEKDLVRLAKQLKKNSIAVDIVNFGEVVENRDRLEKFIATIEKDGNSHLVHVPPGPHLLSDALVGSAVIYGEGASVSSGGGGGGGVAAAGYVGSKHQEVINPFLCAALVIKPLVVLTRWPQWCRLDG